MSNLVGGRSNQKMRTHMALVECAAQFVREGKSFTVAEVADSARVGRTTAYRYFPSVETLVVHATLYAATEVEKRSIDAALESKQTVEDRLRSVVEASDVTITDHDYLYRTMLKLSLNNESSDDELLPHRRGARKEVLESAIGMLRTQLGTKRYEKLIGALSLFIGIESAVVLRDVCFLSTEKAREIKVWGALAILKAALAEMDQAGGSKSAKTEDEPLAAKRIVRKPVSRKAAQR
ncbi:TetR/AcrR family transcriptional regulator [Paraburkholderia panacisoli]|uniref:TetR/AcrR family transcriptional regulator n=1 Tax=Paraburkholderia panacisoli TaxID=2603818 RepID=A0A5B0GNE0_9BURK|nr:TetR/AcrR family transcriptional regulator [Paraburkholderia panacisoli]KAA1003430.1 TetR/AcrR family transcriptional regulator [Paraburkholderia panacisoli]